MGISTHVLDTAAGRPAAGVAIRLDLQEAGGWQAVGDGLSIITNAHVIDTALNDI